MEETISLKDIFGVIRKHIAAILISMFAGLAVAAVITFFIITPKYSSQAQLIVTLPKAETANVNDVNTNLQMINTYKDMLVGDLVLNEVEERLAKEANIEISAKEIKAAVSINQSPNSQMISVQATSTNPVTSQQIANTTANVFQEKAKDVLSVDKISIISTAVANQTPVSPNNKLNLVIGLVLGLVVGIGLAFVLQLLDRTVKDSKFVTDALGLTILGTIPQLSQKELQSTIQKTSMAVPNMNKTEDSPSTNVRRSRSRV